MSKSDELLNKVELLREHLDAIVTEKELTDPEVLALSQLLDQALNEYSALLAERNTVWKDFPAVGAKD